MRYFRVLMLILILFVTGCNDIEEGKRYNTVDVIVNRRVLIEDFTGQRCTNCPNATNALSFISEQFGDSNIVIVAIHSGPFAHEKASFTSNRLPLCTEEGDNQFLRWFEWNSSQPIIKINRGEELSDTAEYLSAVANAISYPTQFQLGINTTYSDNESNINVAIWAYNSTDISAKLEVWLTEDSITDYQYMPDASLDTAYVHNHIYRKSLTKELTGDDISLLAYDTTKVSYELNLEENWIIPHLSIVAFAREKSSGEVLQVIKQSISQLLTTP